MSNALETVRSKLESKHESGGLAAALATTIDPARFISVVVTEVAQSRGLQECSPHSILTAAILAGRCGLEIGGTLGESYIVPRKGVACFQLGYKGARKLAMRSGDVVSIHADVVRENDDFEYMSGDSPRLHHRPDPFAHTDVRGEMIGCYAVATLKNGGKQIAVLSAQEVAKIRAVSRAKSGPWFDWESEMWKKSAILRVAKMCPMATEDARAIEETMRHEFDLDQQDAQRAARSVVQRAVSYDPPPKALESKEEASVDVVEDVEWTD